MTKKGSAGCHPQKHKRVNQKLSPGSFLFVNKKRIDGYWNDLNIFFAKKLHRDFNPFYLP